MSRRTQIKAVAAALLIGTSLVTHSLQTRVDVLVLAFGLFNALIDPPGTLWVRAVAVGATIVAMTNVVALVLIGLLMWLAWPPAYMVTWALARRATAETADPAVDRRAGLEARVAISATIAAVAIASVAYRIEVTHNFQQTAALFIGIPAILAIV